MNAPTPGFNTLDHRADALIANSYYEASATRPLADDPMLDGTLEADVCVIGAGFSGLSVALECRARGLSVVVLDAHRPGWGASGRNGGQTLVGFAKDEIIERQLGLDGARAAWAMSVEGVALVRERIERYGIDCDFTVRLSDGGDQTETCAGFAFVDGIGLATLGLYETLVARYR